MIMINHKQYNRLITGDIITLHRARNNPELVRLAKKSNGEIIDLILAFGVGKNQRKISAKAAIKNVKKYADGNCKYCIEIIIYEIEGN